MRSGGSTLDDARRRLTPLVAEELARATGQHLVAVQSVLDEDYWRELRSGLAAVEHSVLHVVVEAERSVMRRRIIADNDEPSARQWRLDHLSVYAAARGWLTADADLTLDITALTPHEAATEICRFVADWLLAHPTL